MGRACFFFKTSFAGYESPNKIVVKKFAHKNTYFPEQKHPQKTRSMNFLHLFMSMSNHDMQLIVANLNLTGSECLKNIHQKVSFYS